MSGVSLTPVIEFCRTFPKPIPVTKRVTQQRLAAILAADVAGYTRLMEKDTAGTVAAWKAACENVVQPVIAEFGGRVVKYTGDGFLAEFGSAQDAVNCALKLQQGLADCPLDFRIGINLGDIVDDGQDIHGEGVNVAARLENIAEPGSICISGEIHALVRNRIPVDWRDNGMQQVKHVTHPVQVYSVKPSGAGMPAASGPISTWSGQREKPSIAVLPFDNMSNDPEQDFFADGLTEDILTQLCKFGELFVISRNSMFTYKGKAVRIKEVARDLGVRYVVEGSVRKAGNRVRVTVQLIDGAEDRHLWADRFDRNLEDIFSIQDEITTAIVGVLPGRIEADSQNRLRGRPTENLPAYELLLAGKVLHRRPSQAENQRALDMLDRAITLDPGFAHAMAWRACVLGRAWKLGWVDDPDATVVEIETTLANAIRLDENDADVYRILSAISLIRNQHDQALRHLEKALRINPNYDLLIVQKGELLTWMGQAIEGVEYVRMAMKLNPFHPPRFWGHLGRACFVSRQYEDALSALENIESPDLDELTLLIASHSWLGHESEAARHAGNLMERQPGFSTGDYLDSLHYVNPADRDHHAVGLARAGIPA